MEDVVDPVTYGRMLRERAARMTSTASMTSSVTMAVRNWNDLPDDPDDGSAPALVPVGPRVSPPAGAIALPIPR